MTGFGWFVSRDRFCIGCIIWDIKELWDHPTWANAGWLAADIGCAILPFVPAVGGVARLVKGADKVADIWRPAEMAFGGGREIERTADFSKFSGRTGQWDGVISISRADFEDLYMAGRWGNTPKSLAGGKYAHDLIYGLAPEGYQIEKYLGKGSRLDMLKQGHIIEIKPYHEGVNPVTHCFGQISKYQLAHYSEFHRFADRISFIGYVWV